MITEDQLEQLVCQWFQDTGGIIRSLRDDRAGRHDGRAAAKGGFHGAVIAPEGVAAEERKTSNI